MYTCTLDVDLQHNRMHVSSFMFYAGADSSEKGEVLGVCGKNNDNSVNPVITIVYIQCTCTCNNVHMYMYIHVHVNAACTGTCNIPFFVFVSERVC